MKSIVLSQSVALVLYSIEDALEVWFGTKFLLLDSTIKGDSPESYQRSVFVTARFRQKGGKKEVAVSCTLTTKQIFKNWWFVEQKPFDVTINGDKFTVVWQEPKSDLYEFIRVSVSDNKGTCWVGYSPEEGERWLGESGKF